MDDIEQKLRDPPLTSREQEVVFQSWERVAPDADAVVSDFYTRLFKDEPRLRQLFPTDLYEQRKKLIGALNFAIHSLADSAKLTPVLRELGAKHVGYGVQPEDYDAVGRALLQTLEHKLGKAFTAEVRAGWQKAYAQLASAMRST